MPVECPNSLVAFFPREVYLHVSPDAVLSRLLEMFGRPNLVAIQFLHHGAVRLTFRDAASCDRVRSEGLLYDGHHVRLSPVDQRSKLVYVRDLPCEVPDDVVRAALRPFGEVHSITRSEHRRFPGLFDGSLVVKMSLVKDIPSFFSVAGYDCRTWYRRQPQWCPVCRAAGHRARECPLNGVCRRCRQPGHVARECQRAWGGPTPGRPRSQAQASAEPSASGPAANAEDVGSVSPGDNSEMEVTDSPLAVSDGADSSPPGSAPVPEAVDESASDVLSGDEEVISAASAVVIGSLCSPRRTRKRKPRADPPSPSGDELPSKTVAVEVATPAQSLDQQQCGSQASPAPPSTPVSGFDSSPQPVVVLPPPPTYVSRFSVASGCLSTGFYHPPGGLCLVPGRLHPDA